MTQFADLVTKAWAHAKCPLADLYLAGYEGDYKERSALLSDEPKAFSEDFIARAEELTGCTFNRLPVDVRMGLNLEYDYWMVQFQNVDSKSMWADGDKDWHHTLSNRVSNLRKAIKELSYE